jgi:hypothetical protein
VARPGSLGRCGLGAVGDERAADQLWLAEQDEATREAAKHAYSEVFPDGVLERPYVLILGTRL